MAKLADRGSATRKEPRTAVRLDLTDVVWTADGATAIRCMSTDVSPQGLGVVGFFPFERFMPLMVKINGKTIPVVVSWVRRDPAREQVFHAGLKTVESGANLFKEFRRAGILTT